MLKITSCPPTFTFALLLLFVLKFFSHTFCCLVRSPFPIYIPFSYFSSSLQQRTNVRNVNVLFCFSTLSNLLFFYNCFFRNIDACLLLTITLTRILPRRLSGEGKHLSFSPGGVVYNIPGKENLLN